LLQEYFMDLYLLAELKTISLKITTVDMKRPPADFRYIYSLYSLCFAQKAKYCSKA
jgi:hypothetical protein